MIHSMCEVCGIFGKFEEQNEEQSIKQGKVCTNVQSKLNPEMK